MTDVGTADVAAGTLEVSAEPSVVEPIGTFDTFPIDAAVRASIAALGYVHPTDVQAAVIEPALAGLDLVVQAKTGSGKTSAFGIPMVERLAAGAAESGRPHALVLAPTRELAVQVSRELEALGAEKGIRVEAIYGGVSISRQATALDAGIDIVVGTPGRLLDQIRRKHLNLDDINVVVLDEADEMLSMGFWDDVTDLLKMSPEGRQTMLFSATLPYQVARAAAQFLKDPKRIDLSADELSVEGIDNLYAMVLPEIPKPRQLLYVLENEQPSSAIIFCNTRNETEMIAKYLTQAGFVAEALAGNLKQRERERVMRRIKKGDLRYMVATDIASRGIDITDLSHVVNYSLPEYPEVYLHRVGRTGRIGKSGVAVSLVDGKGLATLGKLQRDFGVELNEKSLPEEEVILSRRSQRIMQELQEKASVAEVGQHLPVAQEIIASENASQVVAFLLKSYFNAQANAHSTQSAPARSRSKNSAAPEAHASAADNAQERDDGEQGTGRRRRRRRRRGRRRRGGENGNSGYEGGYETLDAAAALAGAPAAQPAEVPDAGTSVPVAEAAGEDGYARVRVNIGFDDGFKGRGSVAKKISALAGLNDGILTEVEAKRDYAVLKAKSEVAELLVERVEGAQIGKKIVSIAVV